MRFPHLSSILTVLVVGTIAHAAMPPEEQIQAVVQKLKKLNPGFDGKVTHEIHDGVVTAFGLVTDQVTDISPLRELKGLKSLVCAGSGNKTGRLLDLSPLRDLPLTMLDCGGNQVSDLSPLKNMKLRVFYCYRSRVSDLSPLKDMKLTNLTCYGTLVSDLSPLKDMKLTTLNCVGTPVSDLSPLKDMKLTSWTALPRGCPTCRR